MDRIVDYDHDFYLEHMRKTMEWIQQKIDDGRFDPGRQGSPLEILVEARWLGQLVAECAAKHRMLMECQRQLAIAARANILAPIQFPAEVKK